MGLLDVVDPIAAEHWRTIRREIAAGLRPAAETHPARTLAEQADEMITRLRRELAEWDEIKRNALQESAR